VIENRALRKIFGPKTDEVTGEWRRLHNEELYDLYCWLNIIRVIKSSMLMGGARSTYAGQARCVQFLSGNLKARSYLGDLGVNGDNIKLDLQERGWGHGLDCSGSGEGQVVVS